VTIGAAALLLGLGLGIVVCAALWLLLRVGPLREHRWSAALRRRNPPPLLRAVAVGGGLACGTVVAASALLVVDLVYHRPDLWIGQVRGVLVSSGGLLGGALPVLAWFQIAHLRRGRI
jgi:hypothetical protein